MTYLFAIRPYRPHQNTWQVLMAPDSVSVYIQACLHPFLSPYNNPVTMIETCHGVAGVTTMCNAHMTGLWCNAI